MAILRVLREGMQGAFERPRSAWEGVGIAAEIGEHGGRWRNGVEQGASADVIGGLPGGRKQKHRPCERVTRACGLKFSRPFRRTGPAGAG